MSENEEFTEFGDKEFSTLQAVLNALRKLPPASQQRIMQTVATFLGVPSAHSGGQNTYMSTPKHVGTANLPTPPYSQNQDTSPKDFLLEKSPTTDIERIACLAYYLTHFRDTPYFKTLELSKLNTEAAQPKFSNAAYATNNATKSGFLVPASKGQKQLSAFGEQFVAALPDRDAAKAAMASARKRRRSSKKKQASSKKD